MKTTNIIGCGRVGQTLGHLLHDRGLCQIQDLMASAGSDAAAFIGAGRVVATVEDMRPADVWVLTVPDTRIAQVAESLARAVAAGPHAARPGTVAFHCSGFLTAAALEPLRRLGWHVGSAHPVLNFASPQTGVRQFPGSPCGLEGDAPALALLEPLLRAIGALCFPVQADLKPLYHAAAVFSSNFLVVLQAIAQEAWVAAGVPPELLPRVQSALLEATVGNVLALGPAKAITGPAARGDAAVIAAQGDAVAHWHPEAGAVYQQMSALARRLALEGHTAPVAEPQTPSF